MASPAPVSDEPPKPRLTAYQYMNLDLSISPSLGRAVIYLDEESGLVQFQSKGHVTPWHGEWSIQNSTLAVVFDCFAGKQDPVTKSARFFKIGEDKWAGHDYKGREVQMIAMSRWSLLENNVWKRVQEYSESVGWLHVYN